MESDSDATGDERAQCEPAQCEPAQCEPAAVSLVLFASAREAAGTSRVQLRASTVVEVLDLARGMFGSDFVAVLDRSRVWVNGEPAAPGTSLVSGDEVAVLPPVSGG